jgi:hypothetical protein
MNSYRLASCICSPPPPAPVWVKEKSPARSAELPGGNPDDRRRARLDYDDLLGLFS